MAQRAVLQTSAQTGPTLLVLDVCLFVIAGLDLTATKVCDHGPNIVLGRAMQQFRSMLSVSALRTPWSSSRTLSCYSDGHLLGEHSTNIAPQSDFWE